MMLRKWSVIVSAAVVLGSVGQAGAEGPSGAAGEVAASAAPERKFQVNSQEVTPQREANGRRKMEGPARVAVHGASHKLHLLLDRDLTGKSEHKLSIEDMTAGLTLDYVLNPQTSAVTIRFNNGTVRVTPGPNGAWRVDDRMLPGAQAAAKALAEDERLKGVPAELLGGLVLGVDLVLGGASTTPRLDEAWQAAVASRG